jgi:hypothetical protein
VSTSLALLIINPAKKITLQERQIMTSSRILRAR